MKNIKYYTCLLALLILSGACKKENATANDHFIFGVYGTFCLSSCGTYYNVKNNQLYIDTLVKPISGPFTFAPTPLAQSKYQIAKAVQDSLPQYLLSHPNQTFGCPGCTDGPGLYIELVQNGQKTYWNIDDLSTSLPTPVQNYVKQINTALKQLY